MEYKIELIGYDRFEVYMMESILLYTIYDTKTNLKYRYKIPTLINTKML